MKKGKHLDTTERCIIEYMLNNRQSFKSIARELGRDPCTISREVRLRYITRKKGSFVYSFNDCKNRKDCSHRHLCNQNCNRHCSLCASCHAYCDDYVKEVCSRLLKPPYVCNGCSDNGRCTLERHVYSAKEADLDYRKLLSESRSGIDLSEERLAQIDAIVSPLVKQKQSIYHIWLNNRDRLMISEKTLYNYIDRGLLSVGNIDLPLKVRYRPRKKENETGFKVDRKCFVNRTYDDYLAFMQEHENLPVAELDSVVGKKENPGGCFMTIALERCDFIMVFYRKHNDSASVTEIFRNLYDSLGRESYMKLFPVILADRGSEFTNPEAVEFSPEGHRISNVFYCNPSSPYQKPVIENLNRFLRRIVPKGSSMGKYEGKTGLIMSHLNSYKRKSLGNKSAIEVFRFLYPSIADKVMRVLDVKEVNPNDIILTPELIK